MNFLKKLGLFITTAASDFLGIAPIVAPLISGLLGSNPKAQALVTTGVNDLTQVGKIVVQAEALLQTTGSGAQKLAAATPLVAGIVKTSQLLSGHKIANEALFIQGCQSITSGVADVLNSLDGSAVPSTSPAPSPSSTPLPSA